MNICHKAADLSAAFIFYAKLLLPVGLSHFSKIIPIMHPDINTEQKKGGILDGVTMEVRL
jgi:hypothetical protein